MSDEIVDSFGRTIQRDHVDRDHVERDHVGRRDSREYGSNQDSREHRGDRHFQMTPRDEGYGERRRPFNKDDRRHSGEHEHGFRRDRDSFGGRSGGDRQFGGRGSHGFQGHRGRDSRGEGRDAEHNHRDRSRERDRERAPFTPHSAPGLMPAPDLSQGPKLPVTPSAASNRNSANVPPLPRAYSLSPVYAKILPLRTFKNFMISQSEDLTPEEFKRRYDLYCTNYVHNFSDAFFEASKGEEWFQNRYNPVCHKRVESETEVWAQQEARSFKKELETNPVAMVKASCLDPLPPAPPLGPPPVQSNTSATVGADENSNESEEPADPTPAPALTAPSDESGTVAEEEIFGKHIRGHANRTVYVTTIHSSCTKQTFVSNITYLLNAAKIPAPERVLMSNAVWGQRQPSKFERSAWLVMPTVASAKAAANELRDAFIIIESAPNADGTKVPLCRFPVVVTLHTPRPMRATDWSSSSIRVAADTGKAQELAAALDEDRNIPDEFRLATILKSSDEFAQAYKKPTDVLDICIAYLRRVHFVAYYQYRWFRDEAHLLSQGPGVMYRSVPYYLYGPAAVQGTVGAPDTSLSAAPSIVSSDEDFSSRKRGRDDDAEDGDDGNADQDQNDDQEEGEAESGPSATATVPSVATEAGNAITKVEVFVPRFKGKQPPQWDRRVAEMISEVKRRVVRKSAAKHTDSEEAATADPATKRDDEASEIAERQQAVLMRCVMDKSIKEDGKFRCWFTYCNKLFKGCDFLCKHIATKHVEFHLDLTSPEAEPAMRRNYEADAFLSRPLPPIEAEVGSGGIEWRGIGDILDKHAPRRDVVEPLPGLIRGSIVPIRPLPAREFIERPRNSWVLAPVHVERPRERDDLLIDDATPKRYSNGESAPRAPTLIVPFVPPPPPTDPPRPPPAPPATPAGDFSPSTSNSAPARPMRSYFDIDAPKETVADIDYGVVVLPPPKKKKLTPKK